MKILPLRILMILGLDNVTVGQNLVIRRLDDLYPGQFTVCSTAEMAEVYFKQKPNFIICMARQESKQATQTFFESPFIFEGGISKVLAFDTSKVLKDESWNIGQDINLLFDESKQGPGFIAHLRDMFGDPDITIRNPEMLSDTEEFPLLETAKAG